jgi:hypothetical protein
MPGLRLQCRPSQAGTARRVICGGLFAFYGQLL